REREREQAISIGVSIFEVEGQPVVVGVEPKSEAERAGVTPGMIVRAINGKPAADQIAEALRQIGGTSSIRAEKLRLYRRIVNGDPGTSITLSLARPDGQDLTVTLPITLVSDAPTVASRRLASGYGYIRLNVWESPAHKDFKRALENIKDAPGLIIDLRGNPGGDADEVIKIASYFFNARASFGKFSCRSGKSIDLYTNKGNLIYGGPVAILVNEGSGSGSELFSGVMQESGRAIIIGRQSCGCVLGITKFKKIKGGGELAVIELGYISPKGQKFEGMGIIPNKIIPLTVSDLYRRRDATVTKAEYALKDAQKSSAKSQ